METIAATLERPLPMVGLKAQNLGSVERVELAPATRRILSVELRTQWQTLTVPGDWVTFDARRGVFRLVANKAAATVRDTSQEDPSVS